MPFPAPTTFENIAGCLRLSHKYGVDYLRRCALIHLLLAYRTPLSEWESYDYANNPGPVALPRKLCHGHGPTTTFQLSAIQLTREVDTPWILPIAFYDTLPAMYDLPPWEELERMKETVIGNVSIVL